MRKVISRFNDFVTIILRHNIFIHSSSMSYYAALAIAPFVLILLTLSTLLGDELENQLIGQTYYLFGDEVGQIAQMILSNAKEGINLASFTGLSSVIFLLFTASMVFIHLRHSLDTIYEDLNVENEKSVKEIVIERILSMLFVVFSAFLFVSSVLLINLKNIIPDIFLIIGPISFIISSGIGFLLSFLVVWMIYYFGPSFRRDSKEAFKVSLFTSVMFLIGRYLLNLYFNRYAGSSIYGATGTLLIFLLWVYYMSFMLFFSLDLYIFINKKKKYIDGTSFAPVSNKQVMQ